MLNLRNLSLPKFMIMANILVLLILSLSISNISYNMSYSKYKERVKTVIDTMEVSIETELSKYRDGKQSLEKAKGNISDFVAKTTKLNGEYIFMFDTDYTMIMHPLKGNLNGKNIREIQDKAGNKLFVDMVNVVKEKGSGYVSYYWSKPNDEKPYSKVSYVRLIPELNWIIGSGIYTDNVNNVIIKNIIYKVTPILICSLIIIFICIYINNIINNGIKEIHNVINGVINEGRLDVKIDIKATRDINMLAESINMIISNFNAIIKEVKENIVIVKDETGLISTQVMDVAQKTVMSSSEASSIATATEEMSNTAHEISQNTNNSAELAKKSMISAKEGKVNVEATISDINDINKVVSRFADETEKLSETSNSIAHMVSTISEIADQTNLLALNAAIEAARAGEAGRGFSVVADEVRSLASRTTEATDEISGLLTQIQTQTKNTSKYKEDAINAINSGIVSSKKSGDSLTVIYDLVDETNHQLIQIATATEQQSNVVLEISKTVQSVNDKMLECSEECTLSSQEALHLSQQANKLNDLVKHFRI